MRHSFRFAFAAAVVSLASACHHRSGSGGGSEEDVVLRALCVPPLDAANTPIASPFAADLGPLGADWVLACGGWIEERPDGTAKLVGVLRRRSEPKHRFAIDLVWNGRIAPGDPARPSESELDLGLLPHAYVANGGAVDPSTWTLYGDVSGRLVGLDVLGGAVVEIEESPAAYAQIGAGASNHGLDVGGSARIAVALVSQPNDGGLLPALPGSGAIAFSLGDRQRAAATSSSADAVVGVGTPPPFVLAGIGDDFGFVAGGAIVERDDGTARLFGTIARASAPAERFVLDLELSDRRRAAPAGSPVVELDAAAYFAHGGSVDPATWHYYAAASGRLVGLDQYDGAVVALSRSGPAVQVGIGANGRNLRYGARGSVAWHRIAQPLAGALPAGGSGSFRADLASDGLASARAGGPYALALAGVGDDFVLVAGGASIERAEGTARIGGVIARASDSDQRFALDLVLSGRLDADEIGTLVAPDLELDPASYSGAGGPIDVDLWRYYAQAQGTLRGLRALEGAVVELSLASPAVQVGLGANGVAIEHGAAATLAGVVVAQPTLGGPLPATTTGDLRLALADESAACVFAPVPIVAPPVDLHVLELFALGDAFVLDAPGEFVEHADATATLTASLRAASDPTRRFELDVLFVGRVDVGPTADVPPGNPIVALPPGSTVAEGGPVDPATWRYYARVAGRMIGADAFAGAEVRLWRDGPAFQLGVGADGVDFAFGGSVPLFIETLVHPEDGPALPEGPTEGALRIAIEECP